jgi:ubiquinone/menaquinone biosynthesis C-methylase UbiE
MKPDEADVTEVTRKTYDLIASGYARRINDLVSDTWIGRFEKSLLDRLVTLVMGEGEGPAEILDIGCGYGKDVSYLSQIEGIIPIGLDSSSAMLSEARWNFPGVSFIQGDMRSLGLSGSRFRGVWANGCVYHAPKKEFRRVLSEARRVLKPSGVLSFNFKVGSGEQLDENPRSYGGKPRFYAYYGTEEMRTLVARADLKVIEVEPYPRTILGEQIVQIWALRR